MGGSVFRSPLHVQGRLLAFADDHARMVAFRDLEKHPAASRCSMSMPSDSGEDRFEQNGRVSDDTAEVGDDLSDETGDPLVATGILIVTTAMLLGSMVVAYVLGRVLAK